MSDKPLRALPECWTGGCIRRGAHQDLVDNLSTCRTSCEAYEDQEDQ